MRGKLLANGIIRFTANEKYLQSDWLSRVQYRPYCTLGLNAVLFDKKQHSISDVGKWNNFVNQKQSVIN